MMTTELQDRKLDKAFTQMDLDGDGRIERDDMMALGARILVGFGEAPTTERGNALVDAFDSLWGALSDELDTDRDGQITPAEFRTGMTRAFIDGDRFDTAFRPASQAVAALCDKDGDGYLRLDEFRLLLDAFGTSASDAGTAFTKLDLDGDQRLSVDELVEATRSYYIGADPHAAGNWLFGPLEQ